MNIFRTIRLNAQMGLIVLFTPFCAVNASQEKPTVQLQDLHTLESVSEPSFAPNGRQLVYTLGKEDKEKDSQNSDVYVVDFVTGKQQALTRTRESSEWSAQYTSDGQHVVFLSDRGEQETTQVWIMPAAGGEARNLTDSPTSVQDYSLSPNGKYLAYVSTRTDGTDSTNETSAETSAEMSAETGTETESDNQADDEAHKTPPPIVTERFYFKEDYSGYLDEKRSQIFVRTLADGTTTVIGNEDRNSSLPNWSPDSAQLAYVEKSGDQADRHFNYDVFVQSFARSDDTQNLETKLPARQQISSFEGVDADPYWAYKPQWSPDGKRLLWLQGETSKWIYYAPWQLVVADLSTGNVSKLAWQDRWMFQPLWASDGKSIYAIVEESRETQVQQIDVATGNISYLSAGPQFIGAIAVGKGDRVVALASNDKQTAELYALESGEQRRLSHHNDWLNDRMILPADNIEFDNDGVKIQGFITRPAGSKPAQGYPTVVELHGGPVYQYSREFSIDRQLYASNGYLVVSINPRGSSGRGFDFARAIYADWGNKDSSDILAGLNALQEKGLVDAQRIGLEGWSYGGMLTHYLIARDTRFKAAVSGAGSTNVFATFGHDMYIREYLYELGTPWDNFEAYKRVSQPFLQANKITTPTLFQCTQLDFNVPCIGAEQMFQALKILNIPTRLVIYPNQYHGLDKPSYIEDRMQRNLNWFQQYLLK